MKLLPLPHFPFTPAPPMQLLSLRKNDLSPAKSRGFFQSPRLLDLLAGSDVVNRSFSLSHSCLMASELPFYSINI